ncbi:uroporphyrinogen-III synthase [Actinomyces sp. oral taxon 175]|uniref:uroporphyrinogen-III synthase n=1 Tax=Actinomyces sp. oral taxon 175 TaxID=712119 RepID=UPI00021D4290|nr:uroporphyrinogen-III synthase [Actinomyces sp. oral taxon 175]EGV13339.1 uroporphyrinogen-III synthase [Actinomyces sp. oral taxon 175 str. F0384]
MAQSTSRTDSTGSQPGLPREGGGAPLSGRVVLLPRLKERDRIASALERAGAMVLRAAVTRTVPGEAAALEATARRIVAGEAAWLVLTSARTVEALVPYLLAEAGVGSAIWRHGLHQEPGTPAPHDSASTPAIPPLRVAVVGPATARAWTELTGTAPDLVARGSATALLKEPELAGPLPAPNAARRVLLPASALADPALAEGLRRAGWEVEQVAAYTTVTADAPDLPPDLDRTWATGGVDAVVLTAPSTTRAVLELLGPPPQRTGLVAIGATTAAATRKLGLTVAAVAPSPTPEGVLQATIDTIRATTGPAPAPQEPP